MFATVVGMGEQLLACKHSLSDLVVETVANFNDGTVPIIADRKFAIMNVHFLTGNYTK